MKRVIAGLAFALTLIRMLTAAACRTGISNRFAAPRKRSGALDDDD